MANVCVTMCYRYVCVTIHGYKLPLSTFQVRAILLPCPCEMRTVFSALSECPWVTVSPTKDGDKLVIGVGGSSCFLIGLLCGKLVLQSFTWWKH